MTNIDSALFCLNFRRRLCFSVQLKAPGNNYLKFKFDSLQKICKKSPSRIPSLSFIPYKNLYKVAESYSKFKFDSLQKSV